MQVRVVVHVGLVVVVAPVAAAVLLVPADEVDVLLLGHISRASVRKDSSVGVEHWGGARGRRGRAAAAAASSVRRLVVEEEGAAPVRAAAIVEEGSRLAGDQDSPAAVLLLLLPNLLELPQLLLLLLKLLLLPLVEGRRRDRGGRGRGSRAPRTVGRDRSNISDAVCASSPPRLPIVIGLRRRSNVRKPGPPVFRLLLLLLGRRLWRLALQPSNPRGRRGGGRGRCAAPAAAAIHVPLCRLWRPTFISPLFPPQKKPSHSKGGFFFATYSQADAKVFFPFCSGQVGSPLLSRRLRLEPREWMEHTHTLFPLPPFTPSSPKKRLLLLLLL